MKDDPLASNEGSETDKRRTAELEAKLANAALEMEKAKAQLVPPLTVAELEKLMAQALPYQWVTILVSAMVELKDRPLNVES